MSRRHSPDDEDTLDSAQDLSGEAVTPRGGFMARPGLKAPPRHAVVVRGGNAPESDDIPRARSSFPPPSPPSVPPPPSASEKITLRAIPTPSPPPAAPLAPTRPAVVDSLPPPSDGAVVASARGSSTRTPRRGRGSRWMIVAAAVAGLLLGFVTVAARMRATSVAAQPLTGEELPQLAAVGAGPAAAAVSASASARSNVPPASPPGPTEDRVSNEPKASRTATPGAKRSIF